MGLELCVIAEPEISYSKILSLLAVISSFLQEEKNTKNRKGRSRRICFLGWVIKL
jgi:hypothetical protein